MDKLQEGWLGAGWVGASVIALAIALVITLTSCALGEGSCSGVSARALALRREGMQPRQVWWPDNEGVEQAQRYGGACPEQIATDGFEELLGEEYLQLVVARPGTDLHVLPMGDVVWGLVSDRRSPVDRRLLPLPPDMDTVAEHWIFYLSTPGFYPQSHWLLVPRRGGPWRHVTLP